jgi:hypothetical protein
MTPKIKQFQSRMLGLLLRVSPSSLRTSGEPTMSFGLSNMVTEERDWLKLLLK